MRLLLLHNYYREPGGESQVFDLLQHVLEQRGHAVTRYTRDNHELEGIGPAGRARVLAAGFYSTRTARELRALIQARQPQAALVQNVFPLISPSAYDVLRHSGVPVVQLVYNYRFVCPDAHLFTDGAICERCLRGSTLPAVVHRCYQNSILSSAWYAGILGWHRRRGTFQRIDHFLVPDDFMRRKLGQGGLPVERMTVIGNPFDLAPYTASEHEDDFLLFAGRLVPQKGILTLLRALALARPEIRLRVIGDGPSRPAAEALAGQLAPGRVTFHGRQEVAAVLDSLSRCRALCLPSEWYDNAPLVLYQAYALGKPVVASRINGLPEVVADERDGLLAPPGEPGAWAGQLDRLWSDSGLRRRLGAAARGKAEREFTLERYYSRLKLVLDELVPPAL